MEQDIIIKFCVVGEPGVGKTAVVEGLAQRIIGGQVPEILRNKKVFSLDMASILAGTAHRGQFEARLKDIIKEVSKLVAEVTLQETEPTIVNVVKGSHLTVTHYSNGKTKLEWDDNALERDVREAIASVENKEPAKKKNGKAKQKS